MSGFPIRRARAACAGLAVLVSTMGLAARADEGTALVIGVSTYAGQPGLARCASTARDVADALRRRGLSVVLSVDAPGAALRNAIEDLADSVAASPGTSAVLYVCAAAEAVAGRAFVLPADVDLGQPNHAQTAGVPVLAGLGALAGADGVLVADLNLRAGADAGRVAATLRAGLPAGATLAVRDQPAAEIGVLGRALAGIPADAGASARQVLQERVAAGANGGLAVYDAPPPAAAPPAATPPATTPASASVSEPTPAAAPPAPRPAPEENAPAAAVEPPPTRAIPPARRGPARLPAVTARSTEKVRRLQAALARRGQFNGPVDGRTDGRTLDAIRRYQASVGDPTTGTLTQSQILKLLNAW